MPPITSQGDALLSFSIGQVQPFIEAARTVRDLWTGSYLVSWLTVAAMAKVLESHDLQVFVTPALEGNLLLKAFRGRLGDAEERQRATVPCSPNRFVVCVAANNAKELEQTCRQACLDEWKKICDAVKVKIWPEFNRFGVKWKNAAWEANWANQIYNFFDIRTGQLPLDACTADLLRDLHVDTPSEGWSPSEVLLGLMEARSSVRHIPKYTSAQDEKDRVPPKCSLLGSFDQMGPAELAEADKFWTSLAEGWDGYHGTRLRSNDRFCAISLVKRFAWAAYFADRLGLEPRKLRFSDAATVAARFWLESEFLLDYRQVWADHNYWSGQWLHWATHDQDKDEKPCPNVTLKTESPSVWDRIQKKKKIQGWPPIYYIIIKLDGDHLAELFRGKRGPDWGSGPVRHQNISRQMTAFALEVFSIVKQYHGEVIYSGGDDTLVLLPTLRGLNCAKDLRDKYEEMIRVNKEETNTVSAGIAVVHIKEDLRFALRAAREAEQASKRAGRNLLTLTVCRRSGEHASATVGWEQVSVLQELVDFFIGTEDDLPVSNRWTYKLRDQLPSLLGRELEVEDRLSWEARCGQVRRLLDRIEFANPVRKGHFIEKVETLLANHHDDMLARRQDELDTLEDRDKRKRQDEIAIEAFDSFVTLCQSASFLARGKDE